MTLKKLAFDLVWVPIVVALFMLSLFVAWSIPTIVGYVVGGKIGAIIGALVGGLWAAIVAERW